MATSSGTSSTSSSPTSISTTPALRARSCASTRRCRSTSQRSGRPTSTSGGQDADAPNGTPIRITFGNTELTGRLRDNATARDLAEQLPLTLTFRDHNDAEKTAPLPRELAVDEAPAGHDPAAGDIGYWAPGGDFVLYYDNAAPYFDGIVRIGEIDGEVRPVRRMPKIFLSRDAEGRLLRYTPAISSRASHSARAAATVGSKSVLIRAWISPRSIQSCSGLGRPQNQ